MQGVFVIATCATEEGVERLEKECSSRLKSVKLDLTSEEEIGDFSVYLRNELSETGLYALVNNQMPNESVYTDFEHLESDDIKKVFEEHFFAVSTISSKLLTLINKGRGRIINLTSTTGRLIKPIGFSIPSCMSHVAIEALSDCFR